MIMGADNRAWAARTIRKWDPEFRFIWEIYHETILSALPRDGTWIDVGCGGNAHIAEFGHHARFAAGTDLYAPAEKSAPPFALSRLPALPFRDGCADLVTLSFVVEHLRDPRADFAEIARILKPGGKLVMITTNTLSPYILLARLLPFGLKNLAIRTLYKVDEEDVLPTHHRFNTPARFRDARANPSLKLRALHFLQDVNYTRKGMFWLFFAGHLLTRGRGKILRTNLLGVFEK
jgi:SAM-dependent methyltransferase